MSGQVTREIIDKYRQDLLVSETLCGQSMQFHTSWGLFSPREVDAGSRLLLDHIPSSDRSSILDLGCGYGAIGLTLARLYPNASVTLVDKDFVAIEYCQKNADLNKLSNCQVFLSNGFNQVPPATYDLIVSNLPAKSGKELYYLMFYDTFERLDDGGEFFIVTINGLRKFVKRAFTDIFGNYKKLKQGATYTVAMATKDR
jgi:16S rRNA G1207 methylase RsmC